MLVLSPIYFWNLAERHLPFLKVILSSGLATWLIVGNTLAVAALLVSRWPTFSGKSALEEALKERRLALLALLALVAALLFTYPYEALALATLIYAALIPVSLWQYKFLESSTSA
jgi:CDP-diacylglycerol--serine O-phosphatidyltransferase